MFRVRKQNKYHAVKTLYGNRNYHSRKEAAYAAELDLRKKAGDIKDWHPQERIDLSVNGFHIANYYVDFKVVHNDGTTEYVEVKGFETPEWIMKWRLFEALYSGPGVALTVVK